MVRFDMPQVVIERPPAEVFAFVANLENQPRWASDGAHYTPASDGPVGVGTRYTIHGRYMGIAVRGTREITAYEPPHRFCFTTTVPIRFDAEFRFEPVPGGTRMTMTSDGQMTGLFRWFAPLFGWMTRRMMKKDFATLKRVLEAA